jgi:sporulation protein YlmC with PRC-barrel domain|tara:strand:+ start:321 stop:503 length:183 start_codon:yes stop_codon:yes gene_type:complete
MVKRLSADVIKKLMKKYRTQRGSRVGSVQDIAKALKQGTKMSTFMAKKGGYVRKKTKKKK